jgi:predicted transposase/invertase (TIGR01784 family)
MVPGIDPKIDYAFKRVFGQERNRAVLIHLLNAILLPGHGSPVVDLELLNPFNDKETSDDKLSVVDLKARDQLGRQFNVEMQMIGHRTFPDRMVYYWGRLHGQQLHQGEEFSRLRPTIGIGFLNDVLFPQLPEYHLSFHLREDRNPQVVLSPHAEIHLLELPKFRLSAEALQDPLGQWLYFLRHAEGIDTDVLPPTLQAPEIRRAFEELIMVTQSERDRAKYEERFKAQLDARLRERDLVEDARAQAIVEGRAEGLVEGRAEGRVEGRVEGKLEGRILTLQEVLGQPQTAPAELERLPLAELQQLAARLEQQLKGTLPRPGTT